MKSDPILHVLRYFDVFSYPPTMEEIYLFLPEKMSRQELAKTLQSGVKNKRFEAQEEPNIRYAIWGRGTIFEQQLVRSAAAEGKMKKVSRYLRFLNRLPFLLLTGISGSVSMKNAKATDDIDIFIITMPNRLWTTRFWAIFLAYTLGIKRNRGDRYVSDKVCLNLFFDAQNVKIPAHKQNEYVAHEVLQVLPILNRFQTYDYFLGQNIWIKKFFPNAALKPVTEPSCPRGTVLGDLLEYVLKSLQLAIMRPHRTTELITDTQLWFFPRDFQTILGKKVKVREHAERAL